MKKTYLKIFLTSMLVFSLTCWTATYTIYAAGWTEAVAYFVLTYISLEKYGKPGTFGASIITTIILGRIILELPVRIFDFQDSIFSMFVPIIAIVSIMLGATYYREKRNTVLVLSVIILILLNTLGHHFWYDLVTHKI